MSATSPSWTDQLSVESLRICINLQVYPLEVVFRACYLFTDRCYLFLTSEEGPPTIKVHFSKKLPHCDLSSIVGDFSNELINQKVRLDIARETKAIRELIVAQAFAEADLLDDTESRGDYKDDPKGISR